jgi:hypothetical protein
MTSPATQSRSTAPLLESRSSTAPLIGWALTLVSLLYAALIYNGIGAAGNGPIVHWWQPRGLFFTMEAFDSLLASPWLAMLLFVLPALALFLAVAVTTRSAIASTLALAGVGFVVLCCFYGLGGNRRAVWGFFGWRGSAVMVCFSLVIAAALLAPFLARSWLARGWPLRIVLYLPVVLIVLIAIRDITGTDPTLPFAISPWPVVPMFGIEVGAAGIAALLGMLGLDLAGAALLRQRRVAPAVLCLLLSVAIPIGVFGLRLGLGTGLLAFVLVAACVELVLAREGDPSATRPAPLLSAARLVALGTLLIVLPIVGGQLLVDRDYDVTRRDQAGKINEALTKYYARESVYPEKLGDLVSSKDLDVIPDPKIGFGVFEDQRFTYQNFGTNYLLEFSAPRWVQCAYNPPFPEEEGGSSLGSLSGAKSDGADRSSEGGESAPGDAEAAAVAPDSGEVAEVDAAGGSWSCPRKPPELW